MVAPVFHTMPPPKFSSRKQEVPLSDNAVVHGSAPGPTAREPIALYKVLAGFLTQIILK